MSTYPNHDWRPDEYTLIEGAHHLSVRRSWCDEDSDGYRWSVFMFAEDEVVALRQDNNYLPLEDAKRAARDFMEQHKTGAVSPDLSIYAFAGLEPAPVELPL